MLLENLQQASLIQSSLYQRPVATYFDETRLLIKADSVSFEAVQLVETPEGFLPRLFFFIDHDIKWLEREQLFTKAYLVFQPYIWNMLYHCKDEDKDWAEPWEICGTLETEDHERNREILRKLFLIREDVRQHFHLAYRSVCRVKSEPCYGVVSCDLFTVGSLLSGWGECLTSPTIHGGKILGDWHEIRADYPDKCLDFYKVQTANKSKFLKQNPVKFSTCNLWVKALEKCELVDDPLPLIEPSQWCPKK